MYGSYNDSGSAHYIFTMSLLQQYGWNYYFEIKYNTDQLQDLQAARVLGIQGFKYILISLTGIIDAMVSGALMNSKDTCDLPKVGDWVLFKAYDEKGIIVDVLPRQNELSRKLPGKNSEKQVIAANIDTAFIIQGLDRDFNVMRLQRYLQQVQQCNIYPVIILNKKDLVRDPDIFLRQVYQLGYQCPVILASALNREGLKECISIYLQTGKTYILLGSSGVGKSTLLNALLGYQLQEEAGTSTSTGKGKHTTTARNLVMLPEGSMIIDTPGMREFGMTLDADTDAYVHHQHLEELSSGCRFSDCTHQHEPGCAVMAAVESGVLPQLVYRSYLKLTREQYHFQQNVAAKRRTERKFGKICKQVNAHRKNRKY